MTFRVGPFSLALPLASVKRVHRSAEVTPLMNAPAEVMGILNLAGQIVPVLDLRRRFGLPTRDIQLSDHFLIIQVASRNAVIVSDEVLGIQRFNEENSVAAPEIDSRLNQIRGVLKTGTGIHLVYDLDRFLSPAAERDLDLAMASEGKSEGIAR